MKLFLSFIWAVSLLLGSAAFAASEDYEIILWNQHNGRLHDRGTKACKVEVFNGSTLLWKADRVEIDWKADADTKASVKVPKLSFSPDRVRVTILEWIGNGGGLAEIELLRNGTNIARACEASASGVKQAERFPPRKVIDGITSSKDNFVGYWLLPDNKAGWIELKLPRN
jgi:hypothetical protein